MAMQWMAVTVLLSLYSRSSAIYLQQPSAAAALVGSTVELGCHLQLGSENLHNKFLYWFQPEDHGKSQWFLFPSFSNKEIADKFKANFIKLRNPNHTTDFSLTISSVGLRHTGTYICHTTLHLNSGKRLVSGKGTYLLVHDELDIDISGTSIICRTQIREVNHVTLIWESEGEKFGNFTHGLPPNSRDTYWISSVFNKTSRCVSAQNATATCLLQYMGHSLANRTIHIPCSETENKLDIDINGTSIICRTQIQGVNHATLIWESEGETFGNITHGLPQNSSDSSWISSLFHRTSRCRRAQNATATCLLQYMGHSLANRTIHISCPETASQKQHPHPLLLYSLVLGVSLVLLIVTLVWWLLKGRCKMREAADVVYANVLNTKKGGILIPQCK